jgi:small basic protein (TIGR04137 family)
MSMHRSLKSASKVATRRNVLKRFERIEVMKAAGKWKVGDRGRGLPKTKPPV